MKYRVVWALGAGVLGLATALALAETAGARGILLREHEPAPAPAVQGSGQGSSQGQTDGQDPPKDDSVAAAAKKTKTKKGKTEPGKVYSEDDLGRLPASAVSVFGPKPAPADDAAKAKGADGKTDVSKGDAGKSEKENGTEVQDESYWRKKAQKILAPLEALNEEIQRVREETKRPVPSKKDSEANDPNAAAASDPKATLQDLERQKAELEKQLDALQEEGRRAGAPAAWFR